jgi:hypothetical protein
MLLAETLLQRVVVSDDSTEIDSHRPGQREHVVFSRHWAHATLRRSVPA